MQRPTLTRRNLGEMVMKRIMQGALVLVMSTLGLIVWTIISRGLPSLTWEMVSQTPKGGFYMGKGGGVLNAILGSIYIGLGSTMLALIVSLPIALALNTYVQQTRWQERIRLMLDVLWGIPSIVYGAFGFTVMLTFGLRASLLAGIVIVALVILPIMIRAMDEVLRRMPTDLTHAALALGTTRFEVARHVVLRQMLPGLVTAILLAFGRGIGDAASVLFTAGYTDRMPTSLFSPTATLPLAVLFQLSTPFEAVRERGYASAFILTILVLVVSIGARWLSHALSRYTIK
ncbi:MAG: ABC transporter permease subunit [Chloroflexi bacterium]|nr:ABC transporter permease subunit [Chloroflexota bacterium]